MGVTTFFITKYAQSTLLNQIKEDLVSDIQSFKLFAKGGVNQDVVAEFGNQTGRRITLLNKNGDVLADSHISPQEMGNLLDRPEVQHALRDEYGSDERFCEYVGEHYIFVSAPVKDDIIVRIGLESENYYTTAVSFYHRAIIVVLLLLPFIFLVVFLVSRSISEPVRDLLVVTRRLKAGEFGRRVLVRTQDDIGQLGRAFNELSITLEEMFETINDKESKLNTVLASMDDGVFAVNMDGEVILANRAFGELTELDEKYLLGKDQREVIQNEELTDILIRTMLEERLITEEIRSYPGSDRILAVNCSPLESDDGQIIGAVAVFRDVTELRKLERMRREFVANVSHELRTPLTSIKGFIETLLNGSLDDKEITLRFLRIVNGETDRMISLINDLLDLSRIESGKQIVVMDKVNLSSVFEETFLLLQSKANSKDIELSNLINDKITVVGDTKLLRQVALNLIDNSIKYTQSGGSVWVEAAVKENEVEVTVGDTGVGIPVEHLNRIFERFYRADKARSRQMGGTGLGLSIVKHIVEKHGGTIRAESGEGEGTRIIFTLKLA